jgi:hypothetical protein
MTSFVELVRTPRCGRLGGRSITYGARASTATCAGLVAGEAFQDSADPDFDHSFFVRGGAAGVV